MADQTSSSILNTIKKMLGLAEDYDVFDTDIIVDINSAFLSLNQLGVGPVSPFFISSAEDSWDQFPGDPIEAVKQYVYLKVRLVFDPPSSSYVLDAIKGQISELEFRLNVQNDDGGGD